jgi:hypothetical protein
MTGMNSLRIKMNLRAKDTNAGQTYHAQPKTLTSFGQIELTTQSRN